MPFVWGIVFDRIWLTASGFISDEIAIISNPSIVVWSFIPRPFRVNIYYIKVPPRGFYGLFLEVMICVLFYDLGSLQCRKCQLVFLMTEISSLSPVCVLQAIISFWYIYHILLYSAINNAFWFIMLLRRCGSNKFCSVRRLSFCWMLWLNWFCWKWGI